MKKLIAIMLCLAMVLSLATACANEDTPATDAPATEAPATDAPATEAADASDEKVKISVLRPGDEEKVRAFLEPAIAEFEAANPNIDVEPVYQSWAGWISLYPTQFEADTQPDVIFWWDNKMFDASAHDSIVNLEPYLSEGFTEQIPESVWELVDCGMEGVTYVPSSVDSFALFYNKEVFEAAGLDPNSPPTTWEELYDTCKTITEKTGKPALGVPAITGAEVLEEFVALFVTQSTNSNMLDENSMPLFNTPEGLEALEFIESLVPYFQPSATEYGRGELRTACRDGNIAMFIDGPWAVTTFTADQGVNLDASEKLGIAPVPQKDPANPINWSGTNGWIATREETAEASAKLIEFLMSPEVLEDHHIAYGSAPLYDVEFENTEAFGYDYWKVFYDSAANDTLYGMIGRNSATPAAYYTALEEVWQQLILGTMDAETALAEAAAAAESVTARNQ